MFGHHVTSSLRPCLRSLSRPVASTSNVLHRRSICVSLPSRNDVSSTSPTPEPTPEPAVETEGQGIEFEVYQNEQDKDDLQNKSEKGPTSYREFMDQIGFQYQYASPQQWFKKSPNEETPVSPFPMNPSFKPPPPLSDRQKDAIFTKFLADPLLHSPRRLAQRYNLSLKRVDAILRLKGLEKHFTKGIPLQTGFQIGMDRLLNAYTHPAILSGIKTTSLEPTEPRIDVSQVDELEQTEKRDAARYRYERLYWESTPEDGREPVLPGILESVKKAALRREQTKKKAAARMVKGRLPHNAWITRPSRSSFVAWRRGRVATRFVDVGADFLTYDELVRSKAFRALKRKAQKVKSEEKKQEIQRLKLESREKLKSNLKADPRSKSDVKGRSKSKSKSKSRH